MNKPLMPKATAVWLVENTSLTFEQIAEFCGLHVLEVKGIADGDVAHGIKGFDPIASTQLTRDEIKRGQENSSHHLRLAKSKVELPEMRGKRAPKYTPVSRRHDRPNAILWLLRHHPELRDSQIMRLVGTTKPTIQSIRDRTHWNSASLAAQDPVALSLCSQIDLDAAVTRAAKRVEAQEKELANETSEANSLRPADDGMNETAGETEAVEAEAVEAEDAGTGAGEAGDIEAEDVEAGAVEAEAVDAGDVEAENNEPVHQHHEA